jgi:hypothetical protein
MKTKKHFRQTVNATWFHRLAAVRAGRSVRGRDEATSRGADLAMRVVRGLALGMLLAATSGLWSEARAQSSSNLVTTITGVASQDKVARDELFSFEVRLRNDGTVAEPGGRTLRITTDPALLEFLDADVPAGTRLIDNGDGTFDWIHDDPLPVATTRIVALNTLPIAVGNTQIRSEIDSTNVATRDISIVVANIVATIDGPFDPDAGGAPISDQIDVDTNFSFGVKLQNQDNFTIEPGVTVEILVDPTKVSFQDALVPTFPTRRRAWSWLTACRSV